MKFIINKEQDGKTRTITIQPGQLGHGISISVCEDNRPLHGYELSNEMIDALRQYFNQRAEQETK